MNGMVAEKRSLDEFQLAVKRQVTYLWQLIVFAVH